MAPDVRYQVFISSTFKDLIAERQAVLRAVLEMGHMPAGMELFPATDDSAWNLIKDVIDSSDYYVVIVGGRYGTLDDEGIGYTEREYDYAVSCEKPVISLLHKRPENLSREKTDTDTGAWDKLEAFRQKLEEQHTCTYWDTSVPHFQDHASDNWEPEGAGSDGVVNRSWSGRRSNMLSWSTCSIW